MARDKYNISPPNSVRREGNIIHVVVSGSQTAEVAKQSSQQFKRLVQEITAAGQKPLVYVDATHVQLGDISAAARVSMKESAQQPFFALAVVGSTKLLEVIMYIMRAGGSHKHMRHFTSEAQAKHWLAQQELGIADQPQPKSLLIGALIVGTIGLAGLLGWLVDNAYLTSIIPRLRPINPMAAVGLVILGAALFAIWHKMPRTRIVCASLLAGLGFLALLPFNGGFDLWLFSTKVQQMGTHTSLADSGAIGFILTSIMIALYARGVKETRSFYIVLVYALAALGLLNSLGLMYAQDFMYSLSPSFVMALPLSIGFLATGVTLAFARIRQHTAVDRLSRTSWLIIIALLVVQVITYAAWQLNIDRNQASTREALAMRTTQAENILTLRLRAYTDALRGFSGLFLSSDYVDQGEFETYSQTTNLAKNYPGIRAVSFISQVNTKDLPAFVARHRADTSLIPSGNKSFAIQQQSASDTHYIITYVAGDPTNSSLGLDFADSAERTAAFKRATTTHDIVSSGTVTLNNPTQQGFFVTIPVASKTGTIGYVNVVLTYDALFANAFAGSNVAQDVAMHITERGAAQPLYASNSNITGNFSAATSVKVADRTWDIELLAPQGFGVAANQQELPSRIAILGQVVSLLLAIMFIAQNGARKRALALADTITADLVYERNQALALRQKDETILGGMAEGLIIFDKLGHIERINASAERSFGCRNADLAGMSFEKALIAYNNKGEHITPELRPVARSLQKKSIVAERLRYQRKNGTFFDAQVTTSPLIVNDAVVGVVEVFRDITKELEFEHAKGDFVSLASHQLRTPLSAINWYTEMLLDGDMGKLKPDQKTQIQQIYDGNQRMIELVDALLNVSRLSVGKLRNEPQELSVSDAADSILQELAGSIHTKHLSLVRTIPDTQPTISIDPKLMRIILQNLLSNAVKYTPVGGSITLNIAPAPAKSIHHANLPASAKYILITVADTGYGIPKSQQIHIFEKLYRAENVQRLDVEGTGLGLYIVKEVTEMLGGRIWFESMESVGTTFSVVLPIVTKPSK